MLGTTETTYEVDKPALVPSKSRSDVTAVYLSIYVKGEEVLSSY